MIVGDILHFAVWSLLSICNSFHSLQSREGSHESPQLNKLGEWPTRKHNVLNANVLKCMDVFCHLACQKWLPSFSLKMTIERKL